MNGNADRGELTAATFVELVGTLVDDFDVIDLLTVLSSRCVDLLDAAAAGIMLVDPVGHLRVIGASSDEITLLELLQIQNDEGPCLDCLRSGTLVTVADLHIDHTWPLFAAESLRAGFPSVCAVPLRLKDLVLGCLNLFMTKPTALSDADISLAQALADVSSIAIVQDQITREAALRESQLQHALTSRIAIEQAKGMIAERTGLAMAEAFTLLRTHARRNNVRLTDLAENLVAGTVGIAELVPPPDPGHRPDAA